MAEGIVIRPAHPQELPTVEDLVITAYQEFRPFFPDKVWHAWIANIRKVIFDEAGVLLVAADAQAVLHGVVKFYPDAGQAALGKWPPGVASMRILAVHPRSRGKGYGTLLVGECVRRAREAGVSAIYLYTGPFMVAARHIYEKLGFTRVPEFDRDPGPIAYRLELQRTS
jgi:ribosomal protein S18 acetylase RimI-like enzyme|uniref:GNAT family N-acetyltransferase n=1 Tax=Desulfobacca acetoxidans TaxID=60893 RepID=A0A7C5AMV3_9BACT